MNENLLDDRGPYPCDDCDVPCDEWVFEACCRLCRWRGENICEEDERMDEYDHGMNDTCEECRIYGNDYYYDEDGDLQSSCYRCAFRYGYEEDDM